MPTTPNTKARRDFYLYAKDLEIIDTVFGMGQSGMALQGKRMKLSKTEWVRNVLNRAVQEELRPIYDRIQKKAEGTDPQSQEPCE